MERAHGALHLRPKSSWWCPGILEACSLAICLLCDDQAVIRRTASCQPSLGPAGLCPVTLSYVNGLSSPILDLKC